MSNQSLRQASFRAIGGTSGSYNEDARAAFETEATIPAGSTYNEAMIIWLQTRLSSIEQSLPGLMAAFAVDLGVDRWNSVGSFDPVP